MKNRQWLMWQLIDMSDEEFRRTLNYKYCANKINGKCPHGCKADCLESMLAWLQQEHKESGEKEWGDVEKNNAEIRKDNFRTACELLADRVNLCKEWLRH